jgi:hypothetical protein
MPGGKRFPGLLEGATHRGEAPSRPRVAGGAGPHVMASGTSARGHLTRNVYGFVILRFGGESD